MGTLALITWLARYWGARQARRRLSHHPSHRLNSYSMPWRVGSQTRVQKASGKEVAGARAGSECGVVKERSQNGLVHGVGKERLDEKERGYRNTDEEVGVVPVCEV